MNFERLSGLTNHVCLHSDGVALIVGKHSFVVSELVELESERSGAGIPTIDVALDCDITWPRSFLSVEPNNRANDGQGLLLLRRPQKVGSGCQDRG